MFHCTIMRLWPKICEFPYFSTWFLFFFNLPNVYALWPITIFSGLSYCLYKICLLTESPVSNLYLYTPKKLTFPQTFPSIKHRGNDLPIVVVCYSLHSSALLFLQKFRYDNTQDVQTDAIKRIYMPYWHCLMWEIHTWPHLNIYTFAVLTMEHL